MSIFCLDIFTVAWYRDLALPSQVSVYSDQYYFYGKHHIKQLTSGQIWNAKSNLANKGSSLLGRRKVRIAKQCAQIDTSTPCD